MRGGVATNFLSINEDSGIPSTVVGPSGEAAYLTFGSVQILIPFLAPDEDEVYYWLNSSFSIFFLASCSEDWDVISKEGNIYLFIYLFILYLMLTTYS